MTRGEAAAAFPRLGESGLTSSHDYWRVTGERPIGWRLGFVAAAAAAMVWCAAASADSPRAVLIGAAERTNAASSLRMTLVEHIRIGSETETVSLAGVEQPSSGRGSFVMDVSPAEAGLGQATEIIDGSRVYVHYPVLDTLHSANPRVRNWILVDTTSSLGVNPTNLASLDRAELDELTAVTAAGATTLDRRSVTDYAGTLDLEKAARLPAFEQLLSHLPSASAAILAGSARITYAVGRDGYVHGVTTTITVHVQATTVRVALDMTLDDFNQTAAAIAAPSAAAVMTLAAFERIVGVGPSTA